MCRPPRPRRGTRRRCPAEQPRLDHGEGHGAVSPHGVTRRVAAIGIDAGGDVDGRAGGTRRHRHVESEPRNPVRAPSMTRWHSSDTRRPRCGPPWSTRTRAPDERQRSGGSGHRRAAVCPSPPPPNAAPVGAQAAPSTAWAAAVPRAPSTNMACKTLFERGGIGRPHSSRVGTARAPGPVHHHKGDHHPDRGLVRRRWEVPAPSAPAHSAAVPSRPATGAWRLSAWPAARHTSTSGIQGEAADAAAPS